jgi:predicted nucleotidyltransferase
VDLEQIKEKVKSTEYDFLRTNPHLGNNIILLGLGGSHAYGMNIPGKSDLDIRGAALNSKNTILLKRDFDQIQENSTDTVIYSLDKLVSLLKKMNPNTCEILGLKSEHYLYISPIGQELLDNVNLFISKKCVKSFLGYMQDQIYKLKQATTGLKNQSELEKHILNTLQHMVDTFPERFTDFSEDSIKLYIDKSENEDYDTEIFMDLHLTHYPVRDWKGMWAEMNNTVKSYKNLGKRNKHAIEKGKLGKHMAHTLRLAFMCLDILNGNGIVTYREEEHDLLMSIRNNEWLDESGMPIIKFYVLVNELVEKIKEAELVSAIPDEPNYEKIDEFVASVNERIVNGNIANTHVNVLEYLK